jgi:hypothetical protein
VPRDLFNEADLLKCYGRLWIELDNRGAHMAVLDEGDGSPFEIVQDQSDGSTSVANIELRIAERPYRLSRPLNSRLPWRLYVDVDDEPVGVFTPDGQLTPEFLDLIGAAR